MSNQDDRRNKLKLNKPKVYEKVIKFKEKIERNESIGIIQLQYKYICNFHCKHCSIKDFRYKKDKSLSIEDVKNIYSQADNLGLARTTISGGEPLIFHDLDDLVKAINPDKFYINIDSNGWYLDDEKAKHIKDIGIDRIQLSLDSLNEHDHDDFRDAVGSFKRTMAAVDHVLNNDIEMFMQTVVTKQRLYSEEFINYLKFFNKKGVSVFVSFAKPVGAFTNQFDGLMDKQDLLFMKSLEKEHKVFTHLTSAYDLDLGCPAGSNIFSITQQGDVLICPYFHCSMGNLFKEPLKPILERIMKCKPFKGHTCFLAEDRKFINKYLVNKIYKNELPMNYKDVFEKGDFE